RRWLPSCERLAERTLKPACGQARTDSPNTSRTTAHDAERELNRSVTRSRDTWRVNLAQTSLRLGDLITDYCRQMTWRWFPLLLGLCTILPVSPVVRADGAQPDDTRERFFGAVQAIYQPGRAAQAGVQWERLIFPWSLIQKEGPNAWSDGYFSDQQIKDEAARGIQIVGLAMYTPQWATTTPATPKPTNVPVNLYLPFDDPQNYWGQFMFKLAQRYKGQIDTWVIWNEPDLYSDAFAYTWDGSITDFYQLVKVASQAVRKANPAARVALPGMTYWWDKESGRPLYLARFLEAAGHDPSAAAAGDYFDVVVVHQ